MGKNFLSRYIKYMEAQWVSQKNDLQMVDVPWLLSFTTGNHGCNPDSTWDIPSGND